MRERRGHPRRRVWLPVSIDNLDGAFAVSHDASEGGFLLVSARELSVGARLQLRLQLPPASGREVRAGARVVRAGRNDDDPDGMWPYKAAVKLDEPMPSLKAYLNDLAPGSG